MGPRIEGCRLGFVTSWNKFLAYDFLIPNNIKVTTKKDFVNKIYFKQRGIDLKLCIAGMWTRWNHLIFREPETESESLNLNLAASESLSKFSFMPINK